MCTPHLITRRQALAGAIALPLAFGLADPVGPSGVSALRGL